MKKALILVILVALLLTACIQQATPTATDAEMATKVALILTNMPSATGQSPKSTAVTPGLPTIAVTGTKAVTQPAAAASATPAATSQATQVPPAATKAGTSAPTTAATVAATVAPTKAATAAATATLPAATATSAAPAATATPVSGDPRTKLGTPTWTDKMSNGNNWPTGVDPSGYTQISFQNSFMELTSLQAIDGWRLTIDSLTNTYIEMSANSGTCLPQDRYGLVVRVPSIANANQGYLLGFTCDGKYSIRKWDGAANTMANLINWKTNAAITAGANKTNRLGVMLQGSKLSLYANGVLLGEVTDGTWSAGNFGVFVGAHGSSSYTLRVDEISYWNLP
jgi:hypothetical protein